MTEFTIAAAFFLIPLFLLIPWLGKVIDLRHSSIQMARYEAWEYTAWYANESQRPEDAPSDEYSPQYKSISETQNEARQRFLSDSSLPLTSNDRDGWLAAQANPLWHHHNGDHIDSPMLAASLSATGSSTMDSNGDTPDFLGIYTVAAEIMGFIGDVLGAFSDLIGAPGNFDAINTNGLFSSTINLPLVDIPDGGNALTSEEMDTLSITARAGVLTDGWNAGGREHSMTRVQGLVATSLLDNPVTGTVQDLIGIIAPELRGCDPLVDILTPFPFGPIVKPAFPYDIPFGEDPDSGDDVGSLWWGHVDIDSVNPDRLSLNPDELEPVGESSCDDSTGVCQFEGDDLPTRVPRILSDGVCYYG